MTEEQPKLFRPWRFSEVPVGYVLRRKDSSERLLIVGVQGSSVYLGPDPQSYNSEELLDKFVYDNTGEPCGVLEVTK